jgi:Ca-activated chloride channel family protein
VAGLAVPALAATIAARRRAGRYAIRFPAVATLQLAAGGAGHSWRRHHPATFILAAIAALALALARPHRWSVRRRGRARKDPIDTSRR